MEGQDLTCSNQRDCSQQAAELEAPDRRHGTAESEPGRRLSVDICAVTSSSDRGAHSGPDHLKSRVLIGNNLMINLAVKAVSNSKRTTPLDGGIIILLLLTVSLKTPLKLTTLGRYTACDGTLDVCCFFNCLLLE